MSQRSASERYVVEPEITDARIARQWAGTEQRMATIGRARWRLPALAVGFAAVAVLLGVLVRSRGTAHVTEGALLESSDSRTITLSDGSRVDLGPHSRLRVNALEPSRIELALEQGSARFDVPHTTSRRFVVQADRFDIVDVGTRFAVDLAGPNAITVVVDQGAVRVERRGSSEPARFLSGGERWSTSQPEHADLPPLDAGDVTTAAAPSPTPSAVAPETSAPTPGAAPVARPASSRELLESAQRAQRAGRLGDAAATYDRLRRTFRGDARAGLAAFELGRLRLGSLGDPGGAAEAFKDAIALSPNAPFREDAEARLVDAFDAAGDTARCAAARSAYLAEYPHGLHAGSLSARCARAR